MDPPEPAGSGGLGNPKARPPRCNLAKRWCFTLNNYSEDDLKKIIEICGSNGKYLIGREIGKEKGTPHLQGYFECRKKIRAINFFNMKEIHFEVAKGTREHNIKYCSKDGNYETNMTSKRPLQLISDLYPWQKWVENIIKQIPDERSIYWIWEENGNRGKTALTKYLCAKYGAIPVEGKKNDILYVCAEYPSDIYIFDLSRTTKEQHGLYDSIEKIKNGLFMCAKYESRPIIRNCPHVIIFANYLPDQEKLSADRWKIYHVDDINQADTPRTAEGGGVGVPPNPVIN